MPAVAASEYSWRLVNGLWGLFLSWGFLLTSLLARTARSWRFFGARARGLLADYGVPVSAAATPRPRQRGPAAGRLLFAAQERR